MLKAKLLLVVIIIACCFVLRISLIWLVGVSTHNGVQVNSGKLPFYVEHKTQFTHVAREYHIIIQRRVGRRSLASSCRITVHTSLRGPVIVHRDFGR